MAGSPHTGTVTAFDEHVGLGEITADDGATVSFQCIGIADGTRTIAVDTPVTFALIPKLGRYEATAVAATSVSEADERHRRIVDVIRALGDGEVTTYGDIAEVAGYPGRSRLVGHILATGTDEQDLPWWRVVNAAGRLVPGHERTQSALLRAEGVRVRRGHVVERTARPLPPGVDADGVSW